MTVKQRKTPLLQQVLGGGHKPILIDSSMAEDFLSAALEFVDNDERLTAAANDNRYSMAANDDDFWGPASDPDHWLHRYRPYTVKDGVLQIPVMGVLLDKFPWQLGRWATGYQYIERALKRGLSDGNVAAIALIIDSPGGEVSGCFECAAKIYKGKSEKRVRAFAANHAYSAAYMMFASAGEGEGVVATSGGVGSIGVVTAHVSYQEALASAGIKVTYIFAGKHKVDGNSYQDLSASTKARIQKRIDKIYGQFTSTVAEYRGMEEDDVRATEALTYDAEEAIEIGLADRAGSIEEELVVYTEEAGDTGDEYMSNFQASTTGRKPGETDAGIDQATYDRGCADAKAGGYTEGFKASVDRINAIIACDAAKERPKAALSAALKTTMTVDEAKAFLADLPAEAATAPAPAAPGTQRPVGDKASRNHFNESMNASDNPDPGSAATEEGEKANANAGSDAAKTSLLDSMHSIYGKPKAAAA
jgi:capsid assembly protease